MTPADAYRAAVEVFGSGARLDMGRLAADLGIGKATLYRWTGSREQLLSHILVQFSELAFQAATEAAGNHEGVGRVEAFSRSYIGAVVSFEPLGAFIRQEGPLAMRLLTMRGSTVQVSVSSRITEELRAEESRGSLVLRAPAEDLGYAMTRVVEGFIYNDQAAELTPDVESCVRILRLLVE